MRASHRHARATRALTASRSPLPQLEAALPYYAAAINGIVKLRNEHCTRPAEMFILLEGALYVGGPAHSLPSSELKKLHDERSSHGLPAPTAEEELALQNARQLTAWQAQANKIHRRLWKGTSQQAYADCQQAHRGGGSNKSGSLATAS